MTGLATGLRAGAVRAAGSSAAGRAAPRSSLTAQTQRPTVRRAVASSPASSGTADDVNFEELSEIIKLIDRTDIIEMEWKGKKFNLTVRKQEALKVPEPVYQTISQAPAYQLPPPPPPAAPAAPAPAAAAAAPVPPPAAPKPASPPVSGGIEIQSPMSGTFYSSAAPGEPAFVKVGDRVKKGQTVGIIEAMKLMNEIEAEASGEVIKLMAENGKPITAGQPLMLLRP